MGQARKRRRNPGDSADIGPDQTGLRFLTRREMEQRAEANRLAKWLEYNKIGDRTKKNLQVGSCCPAPSS